MSDFQIEKGVPMPTSRLWRGTKYPWLLLDVGDSFTADPHKNIYTAVHAANRRYSPKRFITRKEGERVRVWRSA